MGLMGSLYVGVSGLQTGQNALNTTAHNMANIDSDAYVRQQVLQGAMSYTTISFNPNGISNLEVGMGVKYSRVRQVRDAILDQNYRKEAGRLSFYAASEATLEEVQTLLGEIDPDENSTAFSNSLNRLWSAVEELSKTPQESARKTVLIERAVEFLDRAGTIYDGLANYQDNLNLQAKECVEKINKIGKEIKSLNDQICTIEAGGREKANDMRDRRNQLLDQLGGMVNMSYKEDTKGAVSIQIEGESFLDGWRLNEIGLKEDIKTGFYTAFWTLNAPCTINSNGTKEYQTEGAEVFDFTKTISQVTDTDVGQLKAILLARGDHRANYTDLLDADHYRENVSQSIMMNMQAQFDQLIHNVTTAMNKVLADASDPATGYLCDTDGSPLQIFQKKGSEAYTKDSATGNYIYNPESTVPTLITSGLYSITNLQVNTHLVQDPNLLNLKRADESIDHETLKKLTKVFEEEIYTLNPTLEKKNNFTGYYQDLLLQVGGGAKSFSDLTDYENGVVASIDAARQQIMSVSDDEEMTNMVKYQNAYNAASRYINVINEMLEHLVSTLGR